jgi:hypothetical protein
MSGFRSRFPTVTPWTTDQDLPDIVFRPCFMAIVNELEPARPSGAARHRAGPPGRRRPAPREPAPGGTDRTPGPAARERDSRWHRSQERRRAVRPGSGAHGRQADRGPRAGRDDAPRSRPGLPEDPPRARSPSRPRRGPYRPSSVTFIPRVVTRPRAGNSARGRYPREAGRRLVTREFAGRNRCAGGGFRTRTSCVITGRR